MITQAEQKRVRALHENKGRSGANRFLVQGRKVVQELLASTWKVHALYASEDAAIFVQPAAASRGIAVNVLGRHELDKIGTFESGNEIIAVVEQALPVPPDVPAAKELVLALDGVRDPRNLGGLLRIADWFGVSRILCSSDTIDLYNPKVVQSTMGSIFRVPVSYTSLAAELPRLATAGVRIYLADMGGVSVHRVALERPAVLVLGSESHGLSASLAGAHAQVIAVPRVGHAESLNVAMAGAALCAEFARQAEVG